MYEFIYTFSRIHKHRNRYHINNNVKPPKMVNGKVLGGIKIIQRRTKNVKKME